MKKVLKYFPLVALMSAMLASCDEVAETTKYDNWEARNQAFVDSLSNAAGDNELTAGNIDQMEKFKLYKLKVDATSTTVANQYIYCKKLVDCPGAERPNYTGYHSTVETYYYGTTIAAERFDGNFTGLSSQVKEVNETLVEASAPKTDFDDTNNFSVSGVISGWTTALQYMREGERWLVYIPWSSAYGTGGSGSILGYSVLTFDMQIVGIE